MTASVLCDQNILHTFGLIYHKESSLEIRPGAKYIEKYSNTLQFFSLINDYNYITITGPVEM